MTRVRVTPRQKASYHTQGFLVLPDVVDGDELVRVRRIAARLLRCRAGWERGDLLDLAGSDESEHARLPQLLMPVRYAPSLARSALRKVAEAIAQQLIGDPLEYQGEHLIVKPARDGAETPPHQDEAYWSPTTDYHSLSIWFPLQDVYETNGCMRYIPRSHRIGVVAHRSVGGDVRNNSLEIIGAPDIPPLAVPIRGGGAIVHHCRTIHGAGANHAPRNRYAYIFGFGHPSKRARHRRLFPWQQERLLLREQRAFAGGYELTRMHPEH